MDSAEEFARDMDSCVYHRQSGSEFDQKEAAALIRERDAAVALAAKRELLSELWGEAMRLHDSYDGKRPVAESFCSAHMLLSAKYTKAGGAG